MRFSMVRVLKSATRIISYLTVGSLLASFSIAACSSDNNPSKKANGGAPGRIRLPILQLKTWKNLRRYRLPFSGANFNRKAA